MWACRIVVAVALVACGPSSGQIKEAREARYQTDSSVVFAAAMEVAEAQYGIADVDEQLQVLVTAERWYDKNGSHAGRGTEDHPATLSDDMVVLWFEISVVDESGWRVVIKPVGSRLVSWSSQMQPFGDGDRPYWVNDKVDGLYLDIHAKLKQHVAAPAPAP